MDIKIEVHVECPECGHDFDWEEVIDVEPPEREWS